MAGRRRPAGEAHGQHFLRSKELAASLVAEANVGRGELVLEIGGGTGVLTRALAQAGANVLVVERDPTLAGRLNADTGDVEAVTVVAGDALEQRLPNEPFAVVANLPFARSGAILAHLLADPAVPLRHMYVIVQWEFAVKHTAVWPATLRGTYWRAWYDASIARRLDRSAFTPPPSVSAAVLRFERLPRPRVSPSSHKAYWRFLSQAFAAQQPLRRSLRPALTGPQIKRLGLALGFGPDARAPDLDADQWARVFAFARSCRHL